MLETDENFVSLGTPLEPFEEDEVPRKKPVNIEDQIVVDEKGRRRFHGAFTGGFSAGYFNTVGSKEGWAPSTFKSSRAERFSQKVHQRPQDFMDEEDIGAFGIAPQLIRPTDEFDQKESRKRARPTTNASGPIPGVPVLEQVIVPVKETVGMKILQRMGWRSGTGIGPKTSKTKHQTEQEDKVEDRPQVIEEMDMDTGLSSSEPKFYGCNRPPPGVKIGYQEGGSTSSGSDDEEYREIREALFAPLDVDSPLCNPKENSFGLGYKGLDRNALSFGGPVDHYGTGLKFRVENRKMDIRGEAFGVGAFEEDDETIYSREDLNQYDLSLETHEERRSRKSNDKSNKSISKRLLEDKDTIQGFIRARKPLQKKNYYPPPIVPEDFLPMHIIKKSRFQSVAPVVPPSPLAPVSFAPPQLSIDAKKQGLDRHALTIEQRGALLGEARPIKEKTPPPPEESPEEKAQKLAKERADRLNKFTQVLQAHSSSSKEETQAGDSKAAFKPFMKNPEKQERYEKYRTLANAGYKECLKDLQPPEMTEWQREREKVEFDRALALYKPMSGAISSRFVSAKSHDISHIVPGKEVEIEKDPTQDPKTAAKLGLFGKLTHSVLEWHPDRLVSKRFNIPHPYPDSKMVGVRRINPPHGSAPSQTPQSTPTVPTPTPQPAVKKSLFDNIDFSKPPPGLLPAPVNNAIDSEPPPPGTEEETSTIQLSTPGPTGTENQTKSEESQLKLISQDTEIPVKPPIDLFKEIFENTSSEDEDQEGEEHKINEKESNINSGTTHPKPEGVAGTLNKATNRGEKGGIFSNLSFDFSNHHGENNSKYFSKPIPESNSGKGSLEKSSPQSKSNHGTGTGRRLEKDGRTGNSQEFKSVRGLDHGSEEEDEESVYGPKPPSMKSTGPPSTSFTRPLFNKPFFSYSSSQKDGGSTRVSSGNVVDPGTIWVEKEKIDSKKTKDKNQHRHKRKKSKERKKHSSSSHHSKKEKKKESRHKRNKKKRDSSSSPKTRNSSSSKKSHKAKKKERSKSSSSKSRPPQEDPSSNSNSMLNDSHHGRRRAECFFSSGESSSGEEESSRNSSSSSSIEIHQSLTNTSLLSKLREMTRSSSN